MAPVSMGGIKRADSQARPRDALDRIDDQLAVLLLSWDVQEEPKVLVETVPKIGGHLDVAGAGVHEDSPR